MLMENAHALVMGLEGFTRDLFGFLVHVIFAQLFKPDAAVASIRGVYDARHRLQFCPY